MFKFRLSGFGFHGRPVDALRIEGALVHLPKAAKPPSRSKISSQGRLHCRTDSKEVANIQR